MFYNWIHVSQLGIFKDEVIAMILETIRREIETSRHTRYLISKKTGVSQEQLSRLMQGRGLSCETAKILLEYFGFEIRKKKRGSK